MSTLDGPGLPAVLKVGSDFDTSSTATEVLSITLFLSVLKASKIPPAGTYPHEKHH
jgi:hypothetical protein